MVRILAEWLQPIDTSADALGLDAIAGVGHGGHFFGAAHTLERYEHAFYQPLLSDRRNFERWVEDGRPEAAERAAGVAAALLERYEQPPLDPAIDEALEAFVAHRLEEYAKLAG